jgi:hypothetical protein
MKADMNALLSLIDLFYRKAFTFAKAEELFGPVAVDKPDTVQLRPPARLDLAGVTLEKLRVEPDAPPFLAGISIEYKEAPVVDFAALAQRYGPEGEVPRLKPWQDIPYRFLVQGADYSGYMMYLVPPTVDPNEALRPVNNLILRRFPAEQT